MDIVNEGTSSIHQVEFFKADGSAVSPVSVTYKVTDGKGNDIIDWTSLAPASSLEITISGTANTITGLTGNRRKLTVKCVNGDSTTITEEVVYKIRPLSEI